MLPASLWHYKLLSPSECVMFIYLPYQWPAWTDLFIITYLVHTRRLSDSSFSLFLSYCLMVFECLLIMFSLERTPILRTCSIFAGLSQTWSSVLTKMIGISVRKVRKSGKQSFRTILFSWGNLLQFVIVVLNGHFMTALLNIYMIMPFWRYVSQYCYCFRNIKWLCMTKSISFCSMLGIICCNL